MTEPGPEDLVGAWATAPARYGTDGCTCQPFTARTDPPRYLQAGEAVDRTTSWQQDRGCPHHGAKAAMGDPELTAEEARDLVDQLGLDLYRAQDALAFVEECCVIAEREQKPITVADVREWLKGARCGGRWPPTLGQRPKRPKPRSSRDQPLRGAATIDSGQAATGATEVRETP